MDKRYLRRPWRGGLKCRSGLPTTALDLGLQARQVLDDALLSIRALSDSAAYITGYADSAEAQRAQEGLSLRRAIAVARFFMLQGVERNRLQVAVLNVADEPVEATLTAPQPALWGAVEVRIDEPHYPG